MSFETKNSLHHSCHTGGPCCENPCGARYVKQADGSVEIIDPSRKKPGDVSRRVEIADLHGVDIPMELMFEARLERIRQAKVRTRKHRILGRLGIK